MSIVKNIISLWINDENLTFLKLIHETTKIAHLSCVCLEAELNFSCPHIVMLISATSEDGNTH